jgi:hypothetical protein
VGLSGKYFLGSFPGTESLILEVVGSGGIC